MKETIAVVLLIIGCFVALYFVLPFILIILSALAKCIWNAGIELWRALFQML